MKVKVQINDKKAVEELLANNPDIEIKIKDAIIDEVAKRATKAINNALHSTVECAARREVEKFCSADNTSLFATDCWGDLKLNEATSKLIRDHVDRVLMEQVMEQIVSSPDMEQLRARLKSSINAEIDMVLSMDAEGAVYLAAVHAVDGVLKDFKDIATAYEAKKHKGKKGKK